jgi:superfamily I DNA and RNA helicase
LGYKAVDGCLDYGKHVVIGRVSTDDKLSDIDIDDQIVFKSFESEEEHATWVAQEIIRNVTEDGMQARDIMIVVTAAQLLYKGTSSIRDKLSNEKISCHIVGDDNPGDEFWKGESVAVANLFKARSNEAPMVYVVHAQNALFTKYDAVLIRNCLYSAITRSTAWVRVVGVGEEMDSLVEEYERIKSKGFLFDFVYPNRYNNLNIAYRETIEDIFVSDPLYLDKMVANIMELIRLGKMELDEDQYCLLKEWISVRKKQ